MVRATSSLGRLRDVMPLGPAWVCTSTETLSRSNRIAAASGSVSDAAAGAAADAGRPPPAQPAIIADAVVSSVLHIHSRRVQ
jgi:hypothetical protein